MDEQRIDEAVQELSGQFATTWSVFRLAHNRSPEGDELERCQQYLQQKYPECEIKPPHNWHF